MGTMKEKVFLSKKRQVSSWQKKKTAAEQAWQCAHCNELLSAYYEVDHRIALMNGGSNESWNLVALCRECHAIKTMYELTNVKKKKLENQLMNSASISATTQNVITSKQMGNQIVIRLLREAINDQDVKDCLEVFSVLCPLHSTSTQHEPPKKYKVIVDTRLLHIPITAIKWSIVNAFKKHFEMNYSQYVNHIEKCAVVVSSAALATTFQALITTTVRDAKDLVCVTDQIEIAHAFFTKSKIE
jgi:hypothetical protein